jgi:hypothetical protein
MPSALSNPPASVGYGYTCKIWMACEIERKFLGGKDLRAGLLRVISKYVAPSDRSLAQILRRELRKAPIEMFHPQLWRLDLSRIDTTRIKTDQSVPGWDEQYVSDLIDGEFEVIAE